MHELSERFDRLTRDPEILDMVHQLLGSEAYIHQSRINFKPGFHGKGFDWHSDFETWHTEDGMPRMRAVSFSIALTDNTPFNGPLMLIPGSHKKFVPCVGRTPEDNYQHSLKKQELGVPNDRDLAKMADAGGIKAPTGPAGSLIIFECNTLHASNANMSPWPRSNLFFVFNSVENQLVEPFCGNKPRPDFLGNRTNTRAAAGARRRAPNRLNTRATTRPYTQKGAAKPLNRPVLISDHYCWSRKRWINASDSAMASSISRIRESTSCRIRPSSLSRAAMAWALRLCLRNSI